MRMRAAAVVHVHLRGRPLAEPRELAQHDGQHPAAQEHADDHATRGVELESGDELEPQQRRIRHRVVQVDPPPAMCSATMNP